MSPPAPPGQPALNLPSLRKRLILALGGAGLLLLLILSLLMVVAENKMEELSLRHWLEAEVTPRILIAGDLVAAETLEEFARDHDGHRSAMQGDLLRPLIGGVLDHFRKPRLGSLNLPCLHLRPPLQLKSDQTGQI